MVKFTVEQIATLAHETNAAYCRMIGDDSQRPWELAPEWQRESARNGVRFYLDARSHGITPPPSGAHESWMEEKRLAGWKYGPVKDADKKEHPCFVPYSELPLEQQIKDALFTGVVAAFEAADKRGMIHA